MFGQENCERSKDQIDNAQAHQILPYAPAGVGFLYATLFKLGQNAKQFSLVCVTYFSASTTSSSCQIKDTFRRFIIRVRLANVCCSASNNVWR
jgi:hypothetical protein